MKRWQKVLGGVVVVVLLAGAGAGLHFRNEIQAVRYYVTYTPEEQAELEASNEKNLEALLEQANLPVELFTDPSHSTEQVAQQLQTVAEANSPTGQSQAPGQDNQNAGATAGGSTAGPNAPQQTYDAELAAMVGEIYALRSSFVGQLDDLLQQAKAEYAALSPAEREKQKNALASKYISLAGGLESSCDSQMESILSRIQKHLKETGGDPSLVKEIRKVYENEKALKKSYYMSLIS